MPVFPQRIQTIAADFITRLRHRHWTITTAESCTGGLLAAAITDIPGASGVFERGIIAYANREKTILLDVAPAVLAQYGAVSQEVASAMAKGALLQSQSDIALSVTGIAGPNGGCEDKPVGLVHITALTRKGQKQHRRKIFKGNRQAIRLATTQEALEMGLALMDELSSDTAPPESP